MKKIFLVALCAMFAFSTNAQTTTDEVAVLQSAYGLDKKQLIVEHMKFTEAESAKFWPVYDKYEAARKELGKQRINTIMEYAKNYDALTDAKATELITATLNNHSEFTKLQEKTFKSMSAAIAPLRAAQFMLLELYLENVVRMEISDAIPLINKVGDPKK